MFAGVVVQAQHPAEVGGIARRVAWPRSEAEQERLRQQHLLGAEADRAEERVTSQLGLEDQACERGRLAGSLAQEEATLVGVEDAIRRRVRVGERQRETRGEEVAQLPRQGGEVERLAAARRPEDGDEERLGGEQDFRDGQVAARTRHVLASEVAGVERMAHRVESARAEAEHLVRPEARVAAQVFVRRDEENVLRGELMPAVGARRLRQERAGVDRRHRMSFQAVSWGSPSCREADLGVSNGYLVVVPGARGGCKGNRTSEVCQQGCKEIEAISAKPFETLQQVVLSRLE